MLKLLSDTNTVLNVDDFYIVEKVSGLDELIFEMSIYDENYPHVLEEAIIEYEQPYLVKAIDAGKEWAKVKCQLNLDELKGNLVVGYSNNSATLQQTVDGVLPAGWTFLDNSGSVISRTIEGNYTPLEVIQQCVDIYGVVFRFDVSKKIIRAYKLSSFKPLGAFASRELNLTEINFKGKSTSFFTRLYAYGKDGLSFADINNGKPYVDYNEYSDKIICAYWKDDRYTVKENLLEAAEAAVKTGGTPERSYECTVYDLAATNPEMYSWQDFSLFSVVKLIDDVKKISLDYQVVEYWRYPYYPEKNMVTLSSTAPKIQNTVKNIKAEIENPKSNFRQSMQTLIDNMAASIAGYDGGNMLITQNSDGKPNGIKIMDTDNEATAQKILWLNLNGITYSPNGANGPYGMVGSFEENGFVADWLVVGTMLADRIKGGTLTLGGINNQGGVCSVLNAAGKECVHLDQGGIKITEGSINLNNNFTATSAGYITAKQGVLGIWHFWDQNFMTEDYKMQFVKQSDGTWNIMNSTGDASFMDITANGIAIIKDLQVHGSKNRIAATEHYGKRLLNAYETAGAYFGDIGFGQILDDGLCFVEIDPVFAETVTLDRYVVFLQAEGPGELYIDEKKQDSFTVKGTPGLEFVYEIKAKQKGYEKTRLEKKE